MLNLMTWMTWITWMTRMTQMIWMTQMTLMTRMTRMTRLTRMTWMTGWQKASQTIDRMVYFLLSLSSSRSAKTDHPNLISMYIAEPLLPLQTFLVWRTCMLLQQKEPRLHAFKASCKMSLIQSITSTSNSVITNRFSTGCLHIKLKSLSTSAYFLAVLLKILYSPNSPPLAPFII